jgi:hypothetical protein
VHTNGTVFTFTHLGVDVNGFPTGLDGVDVINPVTGQNTQVAMDTSNTDEPFNNFDFEGFGNLIIAGDGYAYVPYAFGASTDLGYNAFGQPACPTIGEVNFRLLRVGTDGSATSIKLGEYPTLLDASCSGPIASITNAYVITNADQGVLVSWQVQTGATGAGGNSVNSTSNYVAVTNGTSVVSQVTNSSMVAPVLQAQDGSYYGADSLTNPGVIYHLDSSGNQQWSVPNDSPQIATADGGVIGASGATYDSSGNVTGQAASLPTQSWTGNAYQVGSVEQLTANLIHFAGGFWPSAGANVSANSTAVAEETLYVRNFAPWYSFGPDPFAYTNGYVPVTNPCLNNCFLGDNRAFTTSVGEGVTSRINGILQVMLPGMVPITANAYSNLTTAIYRLPPLNTGTGHPTMTKTFLGNGNLTLQLAGSDPLVPLAPNIDTYLNITGSETTGQVCFSGQVSGDAFPDTEVFVINSHGQAATLLNFATSYDGTAGPWTLLSPTIIDMGSFSNICVPK